MARKNFQRRIQRLEKQTNSEPVELAVLIAPKPDADDAEKRAFDAALERKRAKLPSWRPLVIIDR